MSRSLVRFCNRTVRWALLVIMVALLAACMESATESTDNNSNKPLTVDLGPDFTLPSSGLVRLNAGNTNGKYFQWEQISNGTTINLMNANSPVVSFITPKFAATTSLETRNITLRLTVSDDNGFQAYDDIIITVPPELQPPPGANTPPVVGWITNVIASPGQTVELTATAEDAEDGVPSIRWIQITGPLLGLTLGQLRNSTIVFDAPMEPAEIWFVVEATDSEGERDLTNVLVQVVGNIPPTVNAGGDISATSQQLVTIQGSASDSDGTIVDYSWRQDGGPSVALQGQNTDTVTFIAPQVSSNTDITLTLTVTDDQGATAEDQVVVNVGPALGGNVPPTANAGNNQVVNLGEVVALVGTGNDSDGSIISYSWQQVSGPLVTINNASSQAASFTMPTDMQGQTEIVIQLTVTDDMGATANDEVIITANMPPTANAGPNQSVQAGDTVNLIGSGTDDGNGQVVSYAWSQVNGEPVSIDNPNSSNASFVAPQINGSVTLRLTVTDNNGAVGTDDVVISISTNIPPVADAGPDRSVNSGDPNPVEITGVGTDSDGTVISYLWTQIAGPTVNLLGADTDTVSFQVPNFQITTVITLRLTVTDDAGDSGSSDVSITINAPLTNNPPQANAGVDQTANAGEMVVLSGNGTDPDGDSLSYQWSQIDGPSVSVNNANTPTASFIAPVVTTQSSVTMELTVTDINGASGSDQIVITIIPSNQPPVANAGSDQNVTSGSQVSLNGSGNDPDGSIASYQWTRINGPSVTINNANSASANFTAPNVTTTTLITLRLTVTDNDGSSAFDDVVVTVNPAGGGNASPIADAGPDLSVSAGGNVEIIGSGSDDGSIVVYIWTQISGPTTLTLQNSATPTVSFVAPSVTLTSNYVLRLTVVDDMGAIGSDDVVITVNPNGANAAPVANAGPDLSVNTGQNVSIAGSGNDPDGSISAYSWSQVNGISVNLTGASSPTVQFTAPTVSTQSAITLRLTVTDNLGATGSDNVVVTVQPAATNIPPVADAGADQDVNIQDQVTLTGSGTDSDGSIVSYQWNQTGGNPITLNNAGTATASFDAPVVDVDTSYTFELTVTDDAGDSATDTVIVTVHPFAVLSGTITVASGSQVDSDVNEPAASYTSNDSIDLAQSLFNPVVLGGYANIAGGGPPGRSQSSGDVDDYFAISLSANQSISLYVGDTAGGANDLDLYLLNQSGTEIDASVSPTAAIETLTSPSDGIYYINVRAVSGGSNYVLSVGISTLSTQSNGWRLSDDFKEGDIIVRFKDGIGTAQSLASRASSLSLQAKAGAPGRDMLLGLGNAPQKATALSRLNVNSRATRLDASQQNKLDTLLAAKALAKRSDVAEAGLNYRYYPTAIPNDTNYNLQWHYPSINLPQAWDLTTGSPDVIVAVIDTGVLLNHPDLQGQLVPGYDFIADNANSGDGQNGIDPDPNDPGDGGGTTTSSFHGTHVTGTIAAASDNNLGVAGVAWGVKVMPCRAVGINGGLRYDIEQCVRFAAGLPNDSGTLPAQRADIINLSLGGPTNTTNAPAAYRDARSQGVIVVAAAGNDASNALFAPAAYNGVVSVSATNINRQLASYSNFGSTIDVAAPGGDSGDVNGDGYFDGVLSTGGDDSGNGIAFTYRFAAGTSMASPHLAGVAALMKSVYPDMTPSIFDTMLANGELTDDAGSTGRDNSFGYGIINARKAVQAAINATGPSTPPPAPAVLQVTPTSLNFATTLTTLQINVLNGGEAAMDVTSINNDSGGWLTVTPVSTDASGLGTYDVMINRTGMQDSVYRATITVQSSAGSQTVSVIMQVASNITSDIGKLYIDLLDMETMELSNRTEAQQNGDTYTYTFSDVPLGVYHIRGGTDLDKDWILCELGEACGAYPTMDIISRHIIVDGSVDVMNNLDFTTEFNVNLGVGGLP